MAKTKISEFNANPALNTDIDSINIAEGCAPSGINDAIRELMSQLKDFQAGTAGDSFNGPVGTTTAAAGAFTTLSASSSVTLSGGTANGVAYLNGSKVLTTGSALTYNGTTLGIKSAPLTGWLYSGAAIGDGTGDQGLTFYSSSSSYGAVAFADGTTGNQAYRGLIQYYHADDSMQFYAAGSEGMRLTSTGLGIGTSSPSTPLTIAKTGVDAGLGIFNIARIRDGSSNKGVSIGYLAGSNTTVFTSETTGAASAFGWETYSGSAWAQNMTLDGSGNLGLGVTPSAWGSAWKAMQISTFASFGGNNDDKLTAIGNNYYNDGSAKYIGTGQAALYSQYQGAHRWSTAASGTAGNAITFTQAMTLDASGRLLVGLTSSGNAGSIEANGTIISRNQTINTFAYDQAGIDFNASTREGRFFATSASGTGGYMAFYTGQAGGSEKARIDSSGNLLIGRTTSVGKVDIESTKATQLYINGQTGVSNYVLFDFNGATTGSITTNGVTTAYNTSSDQRLKENIANSDSASTLIDSLQVRKFDWKANGLHQRYGFVAQELLTVAPEAVHQPEDPEAMMAVDYSKLVPMLVKEVQALRQRVAQLEAQ